MTHRSKTGRLSLAIVITALLAAVSVSPAGDADAATACTRRALAKAARTDLASSWYSHRCVRGYAVLTGLAKDEVNDVYVLLSWKDGRWARESLMTGRALTFFLADRTSLSRKAFTQRFGSDGWPFRVSSPNQVRDFLTRELESTFPARIQEARMWLRGDSLDWFVDAVYQDGLLTSSGISDSDCNYSPSDQMYVCPMLLDEGGFYLLRVSSDLRRATFTIAGG